MKYDFKISDHILHRLGLHDINISVDVSGTGISILGKDGNYLIRSEKKHQVFRALTILSTALRKGENTIDITENPSYKDFGYMVDCGRNCVISVDASRKLIENLALMGYSNYQLYLEDTYEIDDQPYFGYFRGRYNVKELQEIEEISNSYGLEFIPCIQTLAHLSAFFKWNLEEVQKVRDLEDILLVGSEATYELIDKMFATFSHLKTRKINIGMDEAFMLGLGRFLNENGYQKRSLLMCQHLERVLDIADKYGFSCSMWSDMFFQLLTEDKNYDGKLEIDGEIQNYLNRLKDRVQLIYWDYYQLSEAKYTQKFNSHKQITENVAFAGGAWKWIGYAPDNEFSLAIAPEAHSAAKKAGVQQVTITGWGDNGGECSQFAVLPTLQAWAGLVYQDNFESWKDDFETLFKISANDFIKIDSANHPPSNEGQLNGINPGRYILYQDILCPLLDNHILHDLDSDYYEKSSKILESITLCHHEYSYIFETQTKLCQILAIKAKISNEIRSYYRNKDIEGLSTSLENLDELLHLIREFHRIYSKQWLNENKVFGLDTIDIRLGGLLSRTERAIGRLSDFLSGKITTIDELEVDILPYNDFYKESKATTANQWHLIATASTIYTT